MTPYELNTVLQGRTKSPLGANITASAGAAAKNGTPRYKSINFAGSADYCRPHS